MGRYRKKGISYPLIFVIFFTLKSAIVLAVEEENNINEQQDTSTSLALKHIIKPNINNDDLVEIKIPLSRLNHIEEEIVKLNNKFTLMESVNKENPIPMGSILHTKAETNKETKQERKETVEKKDFEELKGRVIRLETKIIVNIENDDVALSSSRRSRRAIVMSTPPTCSNKVNCAFDFKDSKGREEFLSKPPGSCADLRKTGHILNGIYPIKKVDKIDLVFCNFNSISSQTVTENRFGFVDVKYYAVHFYVQRDGVFRPSNDSPMNFEVERLNIGKAMDLTTGIFTAPRAGIYCFSYSGVKENESGNNYLMLHLNGNHVGAAHGTEAASGGLTMSLHAVLKLQVGDKITLNPTGAIFDHWRHLTHFTGFLLEEDLVI